MKTKIEMFKELLLIDGLEQELTDFIKKEISLLEKKSDKAKAKRLEPNENQAILLNKMSKGTLYSTKDLIKLDERFKDWSSQKMTGLVKKLIEQGLINKTYEKRVVFYSLVQEVFENDREIYEKS